MTKYQDQEPNSFKCSDSKCIININENFYADVGLEVLDLHLFLDGYSKADTRKTVFLIAETLFETILSCMLDVQSYF